MMALSLAFRNGQLIETGRQTFDGGVRPLRQVEGKPGLYHRIVDASGAVLFENVQSDPTHVPYDTTDDGKTLRGGVATLTDVPLQLRLPAGMHGRLEVYQMTSASWTRASLQGSKNLIGSFDL